MKRAITETLVEASQLLEGLESEISAMNDAIAIDDLLVQASQAV